MLVDKRKFVRAPWGMVRSSLLSEAPSRPTATVLPFPMPKTCQWIENDARPWIYCGCKNVAGKPYCPEHVKRVYQPPPRAA